jgi:hypothetical protein
MNALIMPRLFSRFDTTAPAGLVPASSALTLLRFANFAFEKIGLGTSEIGDMLNIFLKRKLFICMLRNPARIYAVAVFMSVISSAHPEGDYACLRTRARCTTDNFRISLL